MNEQEQSESATSTEEAIETANPVGKSAESENKPEPNPENKPKGRRGAVGKIACPICHEKWHPRKHGSASNFKLAHSKHDHAVGFAVQD